MTAVGALLALFAAETATPPAAAAEPEIVIERSKRSDRYRLPPAERVERAARPGAAAAYPALACEHVGPRGCGARTVPIVTVGGDGKLVWGSPDGS